MELLIMPLFTVDSGADATIETQLKWVETVYNFYNFRVKFWPYRAKNSNNTIPLKGLSGPTDGEVMALWGGASRLYGGQIGYILPVVFAEFKGQGSAGATWDIGQGPRHGLIGSMMTATATKPMCTINTQTCTPLTTAHEIGHAAGLPDLDSPKTSKDLLKAGKDGCTKAGDCRNLMYYNGTYRISYALNDQQVAQIARSGFAR